MLMSEQQIEQGQGSFRSVRCEIDDDDGTVDYFVGVHGKAGREAAAASKNKHDRAGRGFLSPARSSQAHHVTPPLCRVPIGCLSQLGNDTTPPLVFTSR